CSLRFSGERALPQSTTRAAQQSTRMSSGCVWQAAPSFAYTCASRDMSLQHSHPAGVSSSVVWGIVVRQEILRAGLTALVDERDDEDAVVAQMVDDAPGVG